jgi:RNA polymerase sigma-70 factor (ECF subfamily)
MTDLRDPQQFATAYRRLSAGASAAANQVLHDPAAAEDVMQDVFTQLWQRPDAFDPKRGSLASYVCMVARARAIDRWRSGKALTRAVDRSGEEVRTVVPAQESAADGVLRREQSREVVQALAGLPAEQRQALVLTGHGLAQWEIAKLTGTPLGTVKGRIRLGLDKARANLAPA